MTANEFIVWQCEQVRSTITRRGVGFVSLSSADDGASLLARFLAYKARSAHASSSSGRSPISYSFQPAEKETGIFWPCQFTSNEPSHPRTSCTCSNVQF